MSSWNEWSSCSTSCGPGDHRRTRICYGKCNEISMEDLTESQICNDVDCPEIKSCPSSHPFAHYNGERCCPTNKEHVNTAHGSKCDGSTIGFNSLCCEYNQQIRCPNHDICHNHESATGEYYEGNFLQQNSSNNLFLNSYYLFYFSSRVYRLS